jgi:hypothetical protein
MYKMERVRGMIAGFGFLGLALLLRSIYSQGGMAVVMTSLMIIVVAPVLLSHMLKLHKKRFIS